MKKNMFFMKWLGWLGVIASVCMANGEEMSIEDATRLAYHLRPEENVWSYVDGFKKDLSFSGQMLESVCIDVIYLSSLSESEKAEVLISYILFALKMEKDMEENRKEPISFLGQAIGFVLERCVERQMVLTNEQAKLLYGQVETIGNLINAEFQDGSDEVDADPKKWGSKAWLRNQIKCLKEANEAGEPGCGDDDACETDLSSNGSDGQPEANQKEGDEVVSATDSSLEGSSEEEGSSGSNGSDGQPEAKRRKLDDKVETETSQGE